MSINHDINGVSVAASNSNMVDDMHDPEPTGSLPLPTLLITDDTITATSMVDAPVSTAPSISQAPTNDNTTMELIGNDGARITIDIPVIAALSTASMTPLPPSLSMLRIIPSSPSSRPSHGHARSSPSSSRSSSISSISNDSKRERAPSVGAPARMPSMSPTNDSSSTTTSSSTPSSRATTSNGQRPITSNGLSSSTTPTSRGMILPAGSDREFLRRGDGNRPRVLRSKVLSRSERAALERRYLSVAAVRTAWSAAMNGNDDDSNNNGTLALSSSTSTSSSISQLRLKWNRVVTAMSAVCILRLPGGRSGTGFMFGDRWIMTNAHFLTSIDEARQCTATFWYDDDTTNGPPATVSLDPSIMWCSSPKVMFTLPDADHLDYAIVGLQLTPSSFSSPYERQSMERVAAIIPLRVATSTTMTTIPNVGDRVYVIQHPLGKAKQYHEDVLTKCSKLHARYACDTNLGSSGSPVVDMDATVIALHHKGISESGTKDDSENQGVAMPPIIDDFNTKSCGAYLLYSWRSAPCDDLRIETIARAMKQFEESLEFQTGACQLLLAAPLPNDAVVSQSGVLAALGHAMRRFGSVDMCTLVKRTMLYLLSAPSSMTPSPAATAGSQSSNGYDMIPSNASSITCDQMVACVSFIQSTWLMWGILATMDDQLMLCIDRDRWQGTDSSITSGFLPVPSPTIHGTRSVTELEEQVATLIGRTESQRSKLQSMTQENTQLRSDLDDQRKAHSASRRVLLAEQDVNAALNSRLEDWKSKNSLLKKKCALLIKQKEMADNAVRQIGDERLVIQNQLDSARATTDKLNDWKRRATITAGRTSQIIQRLDRSLSTSLSTRDHYRRQRNRYRRVLHRLIGASMIMQRRPRHVMQPIINRLKDITAKAVHELPANKHPPSIPSSLSSTQHITSINDMVSRLTLDCSRLEYVIQELRLQGRHHTDTVNALNMRHAELQKEATKLETSLQHETRAKDRLVFDHGRAMDDQHARYNTLEQEHKQCSSLTTSLTRQLITYRVAAEEHALCPKPAHKFIDAAASSPSTATSTSTSSWRNQRASFNESTSGRKTSSISTASASNGSTAVSSSDDHVSTIVAAAASVVRSLPTPSSRGSTSSFRNMAPFVANGTSAAGAAVPALIIHPSDIVAARIPMDATNGYHTSGSSTPITPTPPSAPPTPPRASNVRRRLSITDASSTGGTMLPVASSSNGAGSVNGSTGNFWHQIELTSATSTPVTTSRHHHRRRSPATSPRPSTGIIADEKTTDQSSTAVAAASQRKASRGRSAGPKKHASSPSSSTASQPPKHTAGKTSTTAKASNGTSSNNNGGNGNGNGSNHLRQVNALRRYNSNDSAPSSPSIRPITTATPPSPIQTAVSTAGGRRAWDPAAIPPLTSSPPLSSSMPSSSPPSSSASSTSSSTASSSQQQSSAEASLKRTAIKIRSRDRSGTMTAAQAMDLAREVLRRTTAPLAITLPSSSTASSASSTSRLARSSSPAVARSVLE